MMRRYSLRFLGLAWKVDFNLSISSFAHDIQGTRNLVDLALGSPYATAPSMIFVSSVGIFTSVSMKLSSV